MAEMPWERLPADTTETCDTATEDQKKEFGWDTVGWSGNPDSPNRCGKKATWINRSTCGCGAYDMTLAECDDHYQKRTKEDEERKRKFDAEFEIVEERVGGLVKFTKRRRNNN